MVRVYFKLWGYLPYLLIIYFVVPPPVDVTSVTPPLLEAAAVDAHILLTPVAVLGTAPVTIAGMCLI